MLCGSENLFKINDSFLICQVFLRQSKYNITKFFNTAKGLHDGFTGNVKFLLKVDKLMTML